jgi:hypothetical protein
MEMSREEGMVRMAHSIVVLEQNVWEDEMQQKSRQSFGPAKKAERENFCTSRWMIILPMQLGSMGLKSIQKSPPGPLNHSSGSSHLTTKARASGASLSETLRTILLSLNGLWTALSSI